MNALWQEHLLARGARFQGALVSAFHADPMPERQAAETGSLLAPLALGQLAFGGPDAVKLLQGQLSNDIAGLAENQSLIAGFSNPQGRLRAIVRVFRREGEYILMLPAELIGAVHAEFRKYAPLYRGLTLRDASEERVVLGLSGLMAGERLAGLTGTLPEAPGDVVGEEGLSVIRLPGTTPRYLLITSPEQAIALWPNLADGLVIGGESAWDLTEIAAGQPQVYASTAEQLLPHHVNLQLVDGIHWKKGCYTGQEIIARMHYRSTLKRHMYHARTTEGPVPAPGSALFRDGAPAGTVIRAAGNAAGGVDLLVDLAIDTVHTGEARLGSSNGPILSYVELPYALVASYQSGNA